MTSSVIATTMPEQVCRGPGTKDYFVVGAGHESNRVQGPAHRGPWTLAAHTLPDTRREAGQHRLTFQPDRHDDRPTRPPSRDRQGLPANRASCGGGSEEGTRN